MEIPLLKEAVTILGLSVLVIYLFQKLKLPTILGFLATGIIFGPSGFGLASASHEIEMLSEIGVVLLLFIIGLEFSLNDLMKLRKAVLGGGSGQVLLTIASMGGVALLWGLGTESAVFIGFLFSLSSTAIVLKLIQERGEIRTPYGRMALGILIFQDIIVVPMMLVTPILAGAGEGNPWVQLGLLLLKFLVVGLCLVLGTKYAVPFLLREIARTRSRELFLLSVVVICFAVAFGTSSLGLSLALGAFLAGLTISGSPYSHQATSLIIPFRELFTSFFFVSVGMLLELDFFVHHVLEVLGLTLLVMLVKFGLITAVVRLLGYPLKVALNTGFALFQVGEFAFILSKTGQDYALIGGVEYQYFLNVSVFTMALTPFAIMAAPGIIKKLVPEKTPDLPEPSEEEEELKDHLIIIGYGLNGQQMAKVAKKAGIRYVVADLNPESIRKAQAEGEPAYYGDATQAFILEYLSVYKARVVVVAVSDEHATESIVAQIREICNTVHIIVRCKSLKQAAKLRSLGAGDVVAEEVESSVEISVRSLAHYLVPPDLIRNYADMVRSDSDRRIRPLFGREAGLIGHFPNVKIGSLKLDLDPHQLSGHSLGSSNIRERLEVTVLGYWRESIWHAHPPASYVPQRGDILLVFGNSERVNTLLESERGL